MARARGVSAPTVMPVHIRRRRAGQRVADRRIGAGQQAVRQAPSRRLQGRPAQREVDRRFVYIDPRPDRFGGARRGRERARSASSARSSVRSRPSRANSRSATIWKCWNGNRARRSGCARWCTALRPEVEAAVERLFGRTLLLDRPTPRRLANWRSKAQQAAAQAAGFAYQFLCAGQVHRRFSTSWRRSCARRQPRPKRPTPAPIAAAFRASLTRDGLDQPRRAERRGQRRRPSRFSARTISAFACAACACWRAVCRAIGMRTRRMDDSAVDDARDVDLRNPGAVFRTATAAEISVPNRIAALAPC